MRYKLFIPRPCEFVKDFLQHKGLDVAEGASLVELVEGG